MACIGVEPEFGELGGCVAAIGGHVQPVVAIRAGAGNGIGVRLETVREALVALGVKRGPGRAIVGALELPVFRVARRHVVGACDGVALDRLGVARAEVILQPGDRRAEPFRADVLVECLRGALGAIRLLPLSLDAPSKAMFTIGLTGVALSSGELPLVPAELVAVTT